MRGTAERREYLFPLCLAILFVLLGSLPYMYARMVAPEDSVFMEQLGRGPDGGAGYLMFARQAWEGHLLFTNRMTSAPMPHTYLSIEWLLYGWIARLPGSSMAVAAHAWRAMAVAAYAFAFYFLAVQCLGSPFKRRLALTLVMSGSGLGWMLVLLNHQFSLEFPLTPDVLGVCLPAYLVNKPHFVLDGMFAVLKYACLMQGWRSGNKRWFFLGGLAAAGQLAVRPFSLPETLLLFMAYPLLANLKQTNWTREPFAQAACALAALLPAAILFSSFSSSSILNLPAWEIDSGFYLTGWGYPKTLAEILVWLGWPAVLFVAALPHWLDFRQRPLEHTLLVFWLLVSWGFTQLSPYYGAGQEAVLPSYSAVPVLLAIAWTLPAIAGYLDGRTRIGLAHRRTAATLLLVAFGLCSPVVAWTQMFGSVADTTARDAYYMPKDVLAGLAWLEANGAPDAVILASHDTSRYIPAVSPFRVVSAHYMYTPHIETSTVVVREFFNQSSGMESREKLLKDHRVRYVLYGPYERKLGPPPRGNALALIHEVGEVSVYENAAMSPTQP